MLIVEIRSVIKGRIAFIEIQNTLDAKDRPRTGSYDVRLSEGDATRSARVEEFDRDRGALPLLAEALRALGCGREDPR